jgi:hypothetical protein
MAPSTGHDQLALHRFDRAGHRLVAQKEHEQIYPSPASGARPLEIWRNTQSVIRSAGRRAEPWISPPSRHHQPSARRPLDQGPGRTGEPLPQRARLRRDTRVDSMVDELARDGGTNTTA